MYCNAIIIMLLQHLTAILTASGKLSTNKTHEVLAQIKYLDNLIT